VIPHAFRYRGNDIIKIVLVSIIGGQDLHNMLPTLKSPLSHEFNYQKRSSTHVCFKDGIDKNTFRKFKTPAKT